MREVVSLHSVFAVDEFPYCTGARLHDSKRFGHVFTVSELKGEKVEDTLAIYQVRKGGDVPQVTGERRCV
jgi:hypothetical protein